MDGDGMSIKQTAIAIVALLGVLVALNFILTTYSALSAPGRVVQRTLKTENIVANYEWFHDAHAVYGARRAQINAHLQALGTETDAAERRKLFAEVAAMQQACRELVAKYNANSDKVNTSAFKSGALPYRLDESRCEEG